MITPNPLKGLNFKAVIDPPPAGGGRGAMLCYTP
jgi:hypothetical protein